MDWNNQGKQPPQVNIDQYIQRMLEDPKRVIMLILLAIAVWGVLSSFYLVDTQQRAVITRFGRFVRTEGPGPHLMIPFGVERKQIVFTEQVQQEAFGTFDPANDMRSRYQRNLEHEASMLTGDLNVVEVKWVVQYFITDPKAYLFNVAEPQKNIRDISQAVMRRVVGDRLVSSVMHDFSEVQIKATDLTQKIFDEYEMG
ncbi:MAG: protease modulator HflK, partial [Bdellovibrionales bacterium]|nr:protease modulator HflK [Bdellovibrionales bacterium]